MVKGWVRSPGKKYHMVLCPRGWAWSQIRSTYGEGGLIFLFYLDKGLLKDANSTLTPTEANKEELLVVHSEKYLESLNVSHF